jgi:hypothetical protein
MRIESWKLVYLGGILSLLSLFIPTHFNGAIGGSDYFFLYAWMLGFIIEFKNKAPYTIYWLGHSWLPIMVVWMLISLILALLVIISSISLIKYAINIKNRKINRVKKSQIFAILLILTGVFYIIFTSSFIWMIPVYGSISLMIGVILSIKGIRKSLQEI